MSVLSRLIFPLVALCMLPGSVYGEDSLIIGDVWAFQGDPSVSVPVMVVNERPIHIVSFDVHYNPLAFGLVDFVPDSARIDTLVLKDLNETLPGNVSVRLVVTWDCSHFIPPGRDTIGYLVFAVSDFAPEGLNTIAVDNVMFIVCPPDTVTPVAVDGSIEIVSPHPRPRDPVVVGGGEDSLCLAWRPPVMGTGLAQYLIFRDIDPSMPCHTVIDSVGPDDTTYCDHGVAVYDTLYYYGIKAIYEDGVPSICSELVLSDITPPISDSVIVGPHHIIWCGHDDLAGLDTLGGCTIYYRRPWEKEWEEGAFHFFFHPGISCFVAVIPQELQVDTFFFWIEVCDEPGNCDSLPPGAPDTFYLWAPTTGVGTWETTDGLPERFALGQNFPNPFNPATEIRYALPRGSWVLLEIYNVLGRRVAIVVDGYQEAGYRTARWNAGDLSSGIYFCRLHAGEFTQTRTMVLLK